MSETMREKLDKGMNTITDTNLEAASEVKETVEPTKPVKGVRFVDEPEAPVAEKKPARKPAAKKAVPTEPKKVVEELKQETFSEEVKAAPEPELVDLDEGQKKDKGEEPFSFAPKTFLQPYMLLILRQWNAHGYEVWERLMQMGFPGFDHNDRATVYRALRQLEREGKVKSVWDTKTDGPARRVYSLTAAGEEFLKFWASGLDQYRKTLDFFFKMYTGGLLPSPFSFNPLTGESNGKKDKK
jgi:poly-beta-hydroxybutyrate-responsive repressor